MSYWWKRLRQRGQNNDGEERSMFLKLCPWMNKRRLDVVLGWIGFEWEHSNSIYGSRWEEWVGGGRCREVGRCDHMSLECFCFFSEVRSKIIKWKWWGKRRDCFWKCEERREENSCLCPWHSERNPWTISVVITWEVVRNAESQASEPHFTPKLLLIGSPRVSHALWGLRSSDLGSPSWWKEHQEHEFLSQINWIPTLCFRNVLEIRWFSGHHWTSVHVFSSVNWGQLLTLI